ncbi:[NiFe]-hydrogenase assembly chaperone HybE [Thiobacillus sp.]|uniref:[NiFe]-hydrogenase assembly chaperone HybE n=1 Tax=Thiobacillus sp. TaxID=924 RepID=UPI0025F00E55|nr:[NiFe]-hydrogenase assembly chaperone HybE [Thiobacillus sp.]
MNPAVPLAPTPALLAQRVDELVHYYRRVQTERMQGIPLLNAALQVEAVGFEWGLSAGNAVTDATPVTQGVLITPWFMSLVRLPAAVEPHAGRVARSFVRDFGIERFEFIGAHDVVLGYHESCALFSPMNGFTSQDVARETAQEVLALTRPAAQATPTVPRTEPMPARRAFLLGRISAGGAGRA